MNRDSFVFALMLLSLFGLFFAVTAGPIELSKRGAWIFQSELENHGFTVNDGQVESPALIIPVSHDEFISKARELDATVWKSYTNLSYHFYVFEPEMQIAYEYTPSING